MINIMVVDDEPLVRLAVISLTDWENYGFRVEYEATNGKQALKLLDEHPEIDIIITDINMPVMDGLDFIAELKQRDEIPGIIVLSAYNDYNLVRQAFKLGVHDYVLKTELEPENLLLLLHGIAGQLEGNHQRAGYQEPDRLKYAKEKWLRDSLFSAEAMEPDHLGIRLEDRNLALCFLWVDDYRMVLNRYGDNSLKSLMEAVTNAIFQILKEHKQGEVIAISPEEYLVFLSFKDYSSHQAREKLLEILGQIRHSLANYLNINISIGVSGMKDGYHQIPNLYREAEANARLRFVFGKSRIIFPEDYRTRTRAIYGVHGKSMIADGAGLITALKEGDREKVTGELQRLFGVIGEVKTGKLEEIYPCYMEIVFLLAVWVSERGEDLADVLGVNGAGFYTRITGFETQSEVNEWINGIVYRVFDYFEDKKDAKTIRVIARAQEYMKNHYNREFTLKMASDSVGLSESHFSYLFTKETGESFIDCLTRLRIEKAKELIESTNLKIYEIASEVGYTSTEHFSRVFKKLTGQSPNQYKNG